MSFEIKDVSEKLESLTVDTITVSTVSTGVSNIQPATELFVGDDATKVIGSDLSAKELLPTKVGIDVQHARYKGLGTTSVLKSYDLRYLKGHEDGETISIKGHTNQLYIYNAQDKCWKLMGTTITKSNSATKSDSEKNIKDKLKAFNKALSVTT